jgi:hypothetical protein
VVAVVAAVESIHQHDDSPQSLEMNPFPLPHHYPQDLAFSSPHLYLYLQLHRLMIPLLCLHRNSECEAVVAAEAAWRAVFAAAAAAL